MEVEKEGGQVRKLQDALIDLSKKEEVVEKCKAEEELLDSIEREKKLSTALSNLGNASEYIAIQRQKLLYNGYSKLLQPSPLVLYHPVFTSFVNDCETIDLEFNSHIMMTQFIEGMTDTYNIEVD
ncbi:8443_t:CDS:2 [Funneliformis caledonium]|uniref:8443_t:CDS:1 n=1 Tax=Funneliformis caledonium TaxID=1117310 RepID=A0A9N9E2X8_9GLOM|nr:8443_t:CDS:2 [Funneliformis caledonium]